MVGFILHLNMSLNSFRRTPEYMRYNGGKNQLDSIAIYSLLGAHLNLFLTFKYTLTMNDFLNFGEALEALKDGKKIARNGWNGKDMFLFLLPAGTIPKTAIHDPALKEVLEKNGKDHFEALGSIRMKTADDKILTGWLASQTDLLSNDWVVLS